MLPTRARRTRGVTFVEWMTLLAVAVAVGLVTARIVLSHLNAAGDRAGNCIVAAVEGGGDCNGNAAAPSGGNGSAGGTAPSGFSASELTGTVDHGPLLGPKAKPDFWGRLGGAVGILPNGPVKFVLQQLLPGDRSMDGTVWRQNADGTFTQVSPKDVPPGAAVFTNGIGTSLDTAESYARDVSKNQGNVPVYLVYNQSNGHPTIMSGAVANVLYHTLISGGDHNPATDVLTDIMKENGGRNTFFGHSQGGQATVDAALHYAAAGGTDGNHRLGGLDIYTYGGVPSQGAVDTIANDGADITNYVHPAGIDRNGIHFGDIWARGGSLNGNSAVSLGPVSIANDSHTVVIPDNKSFWDQITTQGHDYSGQYGQTSTKPRR